MISRPPPTCMTFDPCQLNLSDAQPIGSGAVSQVVHSRLSFPPYTPVAVKILSKVQLLQQRKTQSVMDEKRALLELGPHPFVARLFGTAQSEDELYFVMEHLPNGDLLEHIRTCVSRHTLGAFDSGMMSTVDPEEKSTSLLSVSGASIRCLDFHDIQLITAQLVVALSHVFRRGFVLRDLKPENIVFDNKYRACLIDFDTVDVEGDLSVPKSNNGVPLPENTSRNNEDGTRRRLTISDIQGMRKISSHFCGTAQYVSPEMIGQCKWSYSSDLWALGTIVYEMLYGVHMFPGFNTFAVMKKVLEGVHSGNVAFPRVNIGPETDALERVKDFILCLCRTDPMERLGVNRVTGKFDEEALRRHPFFGDFSWSLLDEQVKHYRAPVIMPPGAKEEPSTVGPLHPQRLDDDTCSLESYYHVPPVHTKEYAKYVFEATADANPFERWAQTEAENIFGEKQDDGETATGRRVTFADGVEDNTTAAEDDEDAEDKDESEEYSDVIDDVGVRFFGCAHPDFTDIA